MENNNNTSNKTTTKNTTKSKTYNNYPIPKSKSTLHCKTNRLMLYIGFS